MKNTGDAGPLSLKDFANSVFLPSVYLTLSFSSTKFLEFDDKKRRNSLGLQKGDRKV